MSRKRKRVVAIALVVCICLALYLAVAKVTSPSFLVPRVERALRETFGSACTIEGFDFGILGKARAARLEITLPEQDERQVEPIVVLEGIEVRHSRLSVLGARYRVRRIFIRNANVKITPEVLRWMSGQQKTRPGESYRLPQMEIADGTVLVDLPEICDAFSASRLTCQLYEDNLGRLKGTAGFELEGNRFLLEIESRGAGQDMKVEVEIPGAQLARLPRPRIGGAVSAAEQLSADGHVRGTLSVYVPVGNQDRHPVWKGDLSFDSLSLSHPRLPAPFTNVTGTCQVSNRGLVLDEVTGNMRDGNFRIETGRVALRDGKVNRIALRGRLRGLRVERLAQMDLPPALTGAITEIGLQSGDVDVEFDVAGVSGEDYAIDAVISLSDAQAQPRPVPVPLEDVHVTARLAPDGSIEVQDARAAVNGGRFNVAGYVRQAADGTMVPELKFVLTAVPLEDEILKNVPGKFHELVQTLGVKNGKLDGELWLNSDAVALDARISAAAMRSSAVPYTLRDVSSTIHWSSDEGRVVLHNLAARHEEGAVRGSGTVELGDAPTLALDLEGRDVPIDEELHAVLPIEARELWEVWSPAGHFDFSVQLRDRQFSEQPDARQLLAGIEAEAHLKNVSVTHSQLNQTVQILHGTVLANENKVEFVGLAGEALGVQLAADGYVSLRNGEPRGVIRVRSPRTELTPALVAQWPQSARDEVLKFRPEGGFEVHAEFRPCSDGTRGVGASLDLILHDLALRVDQTPVSTTGLLHVNTENITAKDVTARGSARLNRLQLGPLYGSDLVARADLSGDTLSFSGVDMKAFGGVLAVEEGFCELPELNWATKGRISHVHLETLLTALGVERKETPSGVVGGTFQLRGNRLGIGALRGNGELNVVRGRLYDIPIVMSVLNLFDLRLPGAGSPVSDAYAAFRIEDQTLFLDDLLLLGGSVPIHCRGTIGMAAGIAAMDQQIDLLFTIPKQRGVLDEIPVVNWAKFLLIDPLRRYAFQARVTGTLGEYKVNSILKPVTEPVTRLRELLQKVAPAQIEQ